MNSEESKRMQFHRTFDSFEPLLINANTGVQTGTNTSGGFKSVFNPSITGIANANQRLQKSIEFKSVAILPDVPLTISEKNKVPEMFQKQQLGHFLPKKRSITQLKNHLNDSETITKLRSLNRYIGSEFELEIGQIQNKPESIERSAEKSESQTIKLQSIKNKTSYGTRNHQLDVHSPPRVYIPASSKALSQTQQQGQVIQFLQQAKRQDVTQNVTENQSPVRQPMFREYSDFKNNSQKIMSLDKFNTLKKQDIGRRVVQAYFNQARERCYQASNKSSSKALKYNQSNTSLGFFQPLRQGMTTSLKSFHMNRDHSLISTVINEQTQAKSQLTHSIEQNNNDYSYPLSGFKKLNQIGLNSLPVKLSVRTKDDFESPDKLKIQKPPLTLTQYELYSQKLNSITRCQTKSRFEQDQGRISVVKLPAQMAIKQYDDLLKLNPEMKSYIEWQMSWQDKKMREMREVKVMQEKEQKLQMTQTDKNFNRMIEKQVRATWCKDVNPQGDQLQLRGR